MTILNYWTKLTQKEYFQSKNEKNENLHQILHFQVSLRFKFQLPQLFFIFWNKSAIKTKKSKHPH